MPLRSGSKCLATVQGKIIFRALHSFPFFTPPTCISFDWLPWR